MNNTLFVKHTESTNVLLWEMIRSQSIPEGFVVCTDYQTSGKGQIGNSWEAEKGKNLLFSIVLYPQQIPVDEQFLISQIVSVAIKKALHNYAGNVTVKWPNDIYWNDKKLGGILIENSLQGGKIKSTVIGVGLNINQTTFVSDAPNPVSLLQISGKSSNRKSILNQIFINIMELYNDMNIEKIRSEYSASLYRKTGFHKFSTENETFRARIISIHPDGELELETESGERKGYYFKEVQFV